jgi:hypothetical protein
VTKVFTKKPLISREIRGLFISIGKRRTKTDRLNISIRDADSHAEKRKAPIENSTEAFLFAQGFGSRRPST